MNSFKLALFNFKNNMNLFMFNIISMIFSIAVVFNFFSLLFNPSIIVRTNNVLIKVVFLITAIVVVTFILFFIMYSNSFFLKQRKNELGIYTFMGIDNNKMACIFAIEDMILGSFSLLLGILSGIIFQKAFLMLLIKVSEIKYEINFFISYKAIAITLVVFVIIFFISTTRGFISILRSNIIDLINAKKHEDKNLKTRYLTGIFSVLLIIISYYYSKNIFDSHFFQNGSMVIIGVILGTFLFFSSFLSIIIKLIRNNKRVFYSGTNIISISNIAYRIRNNYKTLSIITIIVAATIVSLGTASSIKYLFYTGIRLSCPYSFSYIGNNKDVDKKVSSIIKNSKHKVLFKTNTKFLFFKKVIDNKDYAVIKFDDFITIAKGLNDKEKNKVLKMNELKDGYGICVESSNDKGFNDNQLVDLHGTQIQIEKTISLPLLGAKFANNPIIVTENDYNKLKLLNKENTFNGILVKNQEESLKLSNKLLEIPELKENMSSFVIYYNMYNELTGIVRFIAMFLGIVFILSTASIMYMKIQSDAISDKAKYKTLMKFGMDKREIYLTVSKQIGISYILPLLIGSVHAFAAFKALEFELSKYLKISFLEPLILSIVIYLLVYTIFYFITIKRFVKIVTA
ncbi:MAG: FtsX-like permease family protein [Clostridiales bacterium]